MTCNSDVEVKPNVRDYSYVSCNLVMYEDGGGGGGGGGNADAEINGLSSGGDDGGGGGGDFDEDSSWTDDAMSYAGTSDFSSSSSSSGGGTDDDDGGRGPAGTVNKHGAGSSPPPPPPPMTTRNGIKWLKTLWMIMDRMEGERKGRQADVMAAGKRSSRPVKTILRPPTTYKYVIGMSGFPSKVPVYPRRM